MFKIERLGSTGWKNLGHRWIGGGGLKIKQFSWISCVSSQLILLFCGHVTKTLYLTFTWPMVCTIS